jgi:hypothetical protein
MGWPDEMAVILAKRTQAFDHMSWLCFFTGATISWCFAEQTQIYPYISVVAWVEFHQGVCARLRGLCETPHLDAIAKVGAPEDLDATYRFPAFDRAALDRPAS